MSQTFKTLTLFFLISFPLAFQPQTTEELQTAVDLWISDNASALATYGEINTWDVSLITSMNCVFCNAYTFNDDISNWDVSNVTTTYNMFFRAQDFNQDISSWDLSNVTDMRGMFREALDFNQDISTWDLSSVTLIDYLFRNASSFNQDISSWDVSNVTGMYGVFYYATAFNQNISSWDVSNVTAMKEMFDNAQAFNQDISSWDVSNVTTMREMFYNAQAFNQDISSWDVSSVTTMEGMFYNANNFSSDLSGWDVSSVTNMSTMFYEADNFDSDLSAWDVSSVTNMKFLFRDTHQFNSDISAWDVSSVTDMHTMFGASNFNQDISDWDVSNVTDFSSMFWNANALSDANKCAIHGSFSSNTNWPYDWSDNCYQFETRDELVTAVDLWIADNSSALATYGPINSWDVSLITNMGNLFYFKDFNDDISNWDVSSVASMSFMFHNCPFNQDISSWDVSSVNNMHRMFYNSAFDQDISSWDVSHVGVDGGFAFHEFGGSFSDENRCLIHTSFSQQNENWPYNWSGYCVIEGYTFVPDDNFEQALIDLGYDDVLDNYVVTDSISGVTSLNVYSRSISDLTGIEAFVALNELTCGTNPLGEVDLSNNTALTSLSIGLSQLTSLDLSNNTSLTSLICHLNGLTSLDVSANTAITSISCRDNNLTELVLGNNTALTQLWCYGNGLTSLDVSANTALTKIHSDHNQLTALDVSANTALIELSLMGNELTTLDVSAHTALTYFRCNNNELTYLNMKNGVTDALTTFYATDNSLTCIEVNADDIDYATANWTSADGDIDEGVTFSESCVVQGNPDYAYVPDNNFEQALIDLGYDDVIDNYVVTDSISGVTNLSINNYQNEEDYISDLTGIQGFTALETLNISYNSLTTLDMSANTSLTYLQCYGNDLTSINVTANTALVELHCGGNDLTSLDVTNNTALTILGAQRNSFTSLDLSNNVLLETLFLKEGDLTSLDVSNNTALGRIECFSNSLDTLDFSNNTALYSLKCYNNQLTYLNMRNGVTDQLTTFNAINNALTCIETLDPDYATENWTSIDEGVTFSVICRAEDQEVWHVSTNGSDGGAGTQESPFATIQTGINAAGDGNTVHVAAGTYVENISYSGKSISILGEDRETTIVDGDSSGAVLLFDGDDSYTIHLSGFTITNGSNSYGGGIGIEDGMDIELSDLIITGNIASSGGGVLIGSSTGALSDLIISDNEAYSGGGLSCYESELTLHDLYIHDNNGLNNTGGASFGSSTIDLYSSVFTGNHAHYNGGALRVNSEGEYNFTNVTIIGNSTGYSGCSPCHASRGSALDIGTDADVNISNSIIWDNTGAVAEIVFGISQTSGTINMSYTDLHGGQDEILEWNGEWVNVEENIVNWGEGNIDADPLFCESDSGNYQLAGNSPCAGTGLDGADMGALGVGCDDIWFPPTIAAIQDTSMDEDSELMLQLSAESSQGYDIYFEAQSDTSSVYVYTEDDMLHINLETDWNGSSEITVLAYSEFSYESNDTASFTLTVNAVDDLPYVDGHIYPRNYPEDFGVDTVAYLPDVFVDIDGELTFSYLFTDGGVVAADVTSDHLVLSSMDNANGSTQLLVTASNPMRASVTDTVDIEVWPLNDPPVVDIPDQLMMEDSEIFLDISGYMSDAESEELWVYVDYVSEPMNEYVDAHMHGSDTLHLTAHDNWNGAGEIEIFVSDDEEETSDVFALEVRAVNDAPVLENLHALVGAGMEFHVPIHVYDVDMDSLVVSLDDSWDYPDWLSLAASPYALTGTAPEPISIHFPLQVTDVEVTVTDTFHLSAQFFNPRITSVTDVPDDQGGRVYLSFLKSFFDQPDVANQIYTVFRHDMIDNTPEWVVVGSGAAIGDESYTYEVSTLMDSTSEGDGMTEFKVVASMNDGHFHSAPESGYSLDNIAPDAPTGLLAEQTGTYITLTWNPIQANDFNYFSIHRSESADFETSAETLIGYSTELTHLDTTAEWFTTLYYRVNATDFAGNTGPSSDAAEGYVHVNLAPVMSEIEAQSMDEDQSFEIVVSATDENALDMLTHGALSSVDDVMPTVSNDTLSISLTENWFGTAELMVYVTDGELSDTTSFILTVNGVNDAPTVFSLLGPEDSTQITITSLDLNQELDVVFNWEPSSDVDNDDLSYSFVLYNGPYGADALIDTVLSEMVLNISYEYFAELIGSMGLTSISGDWTVSATDGVDTTQSGDVWNITLDASDVLSVDGEILPTVFALHQNYPNPFNPTTKIRYDLPEDAMVSITIYDVMGRQVKSLVNTTQTAGYRSVRWDATNSFGEPVSAGMYIYMIQAGEFRQNKKMVLLK